MGIFHWKLTIFREFRGIFCDLLNLTWSININLSLTRSSLFVLELPDPQNQSFFVKTQLIFLSLRTLPLKEFSVWFFIRSITSSTAATIKRKRTNVATDLSFSSAVATPADCNPAATTIATVAANKRQALKPKSYPILASKQLGQPWASTQRVALITTSIATNAYVCINQSQGWFRKIPFACYKSWWTNKITIWFKCKSIFTKKITNTKVRITNFRRTSGHFCQLRESPPPNMESIHPLFVHNMCKWPGCEAHAEDFGRFLKWVFFSNFQIFQNYYRDFG